MKTFLFCMAGTTLAGLMLPTFIFFYELVEIPPVAIGLTILTAMGLVGLIAFIRETMVAVMRRQK